MKYIGGQFSSSDDEILLRGVQPSTQLDTFFPNKIDDKRLDFFETGIDALAHIVSQQPPSLSPSLWIPNNFCKESLDRLSPKIKQPPQIQYYQSLESVKPQLKPNDFLLVLHFNQYDHLGIEFAMECKKNLAIQVVEDFVQCPLDIFKLRGDSGFNSLRKFLALDMSVCYSKATPTKPLSSQQSTYRTSVSVARSLKSQFLIAQDRATEVKYLDLFQESEQQLNSHEIHLSLASDLEVLSIIDFQKSLKIRRRNYASLKSLLEKIPQLDLLPGDYMYLMCLAENRNELRRHCFNNGIFPAIHWPNAPDAEKKLSFHIDHRYSESDMNRVCGVIKNFYAN